MNQEEPKWRIVERVVKLIEKSLSPEAKIEHNVFLPDLTSSVGSKRQCDVVIRSGKPPRETTTIVEVQDRNKKIDINTFDGWCKKMERVGAQHLICVSTKGFPKSVRDEARKRGPTVILVTLAELERNQWPIDLIENCLEFISVIENKTKFNEIIMLRLEKGQFLRMSYREKVAPFFSYRGQKLSIHDLIQLYVIEKDLAEGATQIKFVLPKEGQKLYFFEDDSRTPINNLIVDANIEIERGKIPLTFSGYIQSSDTDNENSDEPIAWIMNAIGVFKGEEVDIRATFLPDDNGVLRLSQISDAAGGKLFFGLVSVKSKL